MSVADLTRNAVHVLPEGALEAKLALGRGLRIKLGIDPTGPDIHLGFAVVLRRLAAFQREGHVAVLIVGDYTARIGDPSGRSKERQVLPDDVLDRNARLFAEQAYRILDRDRTELRFNGEWLGDLDYAELVRLTRTGTVAQLLERDDFGKRFRNSEPISVSELLYPFAQGYDSVAVEADVEVGGTDQLYNLLMGRDVMTSYEQDPQSVITYELLVGTDGVDKMSKSQGNYVGIDEAPEEQFGKVMSIPDSALDQWWRLCLDVDAPDVQPMESKLALARGIVELYHGAEAAEAAERHFTRVVREGRCAGGRAGGRRSRRTTQCTCRRCSRPGSGCPRATPVGSSRQGGVRVDGEEVERPRPSPRAARRRRSCRPGSAASCGSPG